MHPLDEADAFHTLTREGVRLDDVAAETGLSMGTIKRRLTLLQLCDNAQKWGY